MRLARRTFAYGLVAFGLAATAAQAQSIDALPPELKALYTENIPVGPSAYDDFKMPAKPWKWCHSESYLGNPWRVSMTNELKRLVESGIAKGDIASFELSDSNGDYAKKLGLDFDLSKIGFGLRSKRFSMVVNDGKVEKLNVDESGYSLSSAESTCSL